MSIWQIIKLIINKYICFNIILKNIVYFILKKILILKY